MQNKQLPYQKLQQATHASAVPSSSLPSATKQYYQSPYQPDSATPPAPSSTATPVAAPPAPLNPPHNYNNYNSYNNYNRYNNYNPVSAATTAPTPQVRSNAPGSHTHTPAHSVYGNAGRTSNNAAPQLRNRRAPGGSDTSTPWKSSYSGQHVVDNPYVKTATSSNNPYTRTNPYSNNTTMTRPQPQNGGMGNQYQHQGQGHQQQSYSTSNASRAKERVENAKMVAKQFAQVGEMTATLAEIVEQQDEWIADLETETVEAADHVDRGQAELLKLWQNVSGDRGLMLKLFAVLIFFIVLFFWLNRMR
jgi:hypothetical protein